MIILFVFDNIIPKPTNFLQQDNFLIMVILRELELIAKLSI